jgi:succinate dehydrogenase / fumarate reductase cytochrome b subunit
MGYRRDAGLDFGRSEGSWEVPVLSVKEREQANVGAGLWKGTGMWAWILFRISGLVLACYLFVHLWVISQGRIGGPQSLNNLFATFDKPLLVFLDLMLVAAVLYHALNGVRVVLMDLGIGIRQHKIVFWLCMLVAAISLGLFAAKASSFILG